MNKKEILAKWNLEKEYEEFKKILSDEWIRSQKTKKQLTEILKKKIIYWRITWYTLKEIAKNTGFSIARVKKISTSNSNLFKEFDKDRQKKAFVKMGDIVFKTLFENLELSKEDKNATLIEKIKSQNDTIKLLLNYRNETMKIYWISEEKTKVEIENKDKNWLKDYFTQLKEEIN